MSDELFTDLFFSDPFRAGGFDDSAAMFDYEALITRDFELSSSVITDPMNSCGSGSGSLSSSDAGGAEEEDDAAGKDKDHNKQIMIKDDDGGESSKTGGKSSRKKLGEKKEREARFAFMTKSEVDHLEDGYRWRKYGQKAVKNSAYPRSYYRCTTQKCGVKKRVERSFEDPSIVITTYEGQHNHPIPATLRGNLSAAAAFSPSMLTPMPVVAGPVGFLPEMLSSNANNNNAASGNNQAVGGGSSSGGYYSQSNFGYSYHDGRKPEYGLLQDMFPAPSSFFNRQP